MSTTDALHVTPEGAAWAVKLDETSAPSSVHSTRGLAIASAVEMLQGRDGVEILLHGEDGRVRSSLTLRQVEDDVDEAEDAAIRAEAMRLAPGNARLRAGIARRLAGQGPRIEGDFGPDEEMPY